jgi:hypothetical protein
MTNELPADERRQEIQDSFDSIVELLEGDGMNDDGYSYLLANADKEQYKAVQQFFADFDSSWRRNIVPVADAIITRQVKEEYKRRHAELAAMTPQQREQRRVFLDMFMKGELPPLPPYMKLAPTATGTAQLQNQRTLPSNMNYKQAIALRVNNIRPEDVADLTPREIRELIGRLQQHRNYAQPLRCEICNTTHTIQHGISYREYTRRHEELRKKPADSNK